MSTNMTDDKNEDFIVPDTKWKFDEAVTNCFDRMLERSIPDYNSMRSLVRTVGENFADFDSTIVDLGASRGEAIAHYAEADYRIKAIEISEPMLKALHERFDKYPRVSILNHDLRTQRDSLQTKSSLVLSVLTLQFIPINYRQSILHDIYKSLKKGKALILVEKVLGSTASIDDLLIKCYHEKKLNSGYSYDDIERKKQSLEGVLVPVTYDWNEQMLKSAGFRHIECFFRNLNFAGIVAIK